MWQAQISVVKCKHYLILLFSCCNMSWSNCCRRKEFQSRTISVGRESLQKFPPNVIRNQKYSILSFIPIVSITRLTFYVLLIINSVFKILQVLYNQFKFFLNLFFLIMAVSQFIPQLRIGYLYTVSLFLNHSTK